MLLSFLDVCNTTPGFLRPIREGEEVLNSGLVVAVGLKEKDGDLLGIHALVLRTTGVTTKSPYSVQIWLDKSKPLGSRVIRERSAECDCPAGNSAKCKHIAAVLLYLVRIEESDLEDLSSTDMEQQWGTMKNTPLKEYEGKPLSELCHAGQKRDIFVPNMPEVTQEMEDRWSTKLMKCGGSSEYAVFFSGLRAGEGCSSSIYIDERTLTIKRLLSFRSWSVLGELRKLTQNKLISLADNLRDFYKKHVEVTAEESMRIGTIPQRTGGWKGASNLRITASTARSQYTYFFNKKADWTKRYQEAFHSKFQGNEHTVAGLRGEVQARAVYEKTHQCKVLESGFLIRPELPWLGASLDGTVVGKDGDFIKNLEIKTHKEGQYLTAKQMKDHNCMKSLDEGGHLKLNHEHYAQIQIGLLLTGIESCDYIIYSEYGRDAIISNVIFNPEFVFNMGSILVNIYFDKFLPQMALEISS